MTRALLACWLALPLPGLAGAVGWVEAPPGRPGRLLEPGSVLLRMASHKGGLPKQAGEDLARLAARAAPSVVSLESGDGRERILGFVVGEGLVATSSHDLLLEDRILVKGPGPAAVAGELAAVNCVTALALVRIPGAAGKRWPALPLRAGRPAPGEWVLAIGSPHDLEGSKSFGVVSSADRSLPGWESVRFIQTDAAVNPGSGNGPLLDMEGKVVGLVDQFRTKGGGSDGVAFAVGAEHILDILEQHRGGQKVRGCR